MVTVPSMILIVLTSSGQRLVGGLQPPQKGAIFCSENFANPWTVSYSPDSTGRYCLITIVPTGEPTLVPSNKPALSITCQLTPTPTPTPIVRLPSFRCS